MKSRFFCFSIWLVIFSAVFIFLSWSIFAPPKNSWAFGQLPISGETTSISHSIFIPNIGLRAQIVFSSSDEDEIINQALEKGIVHWPETAYPGEKKNMVLAGHSSGYFWQKTPYSQIFAQLDKLVVGDKLTIFYAQKSYVYQVEEMKIVSSQAVKVLSDEADLTIITCWPAGTTLKRMVVKAKMI